MKRLVLVGAGHAHALVLAELARNKPKNLEVVLVSPHRLAPYSGMIPGWLAGHYHWDECCVDFERLCRRARVAMCIDSVAALDPDRQELQLQNGDTLGFDLLSLNVGSTLMPPSSDSTMVMPMRPLGELRWRWEELQRVVTALEPGTNFRVLTVGGGAAGVESMLAVSHSLRQLAPGVSFQFVLTMEGGDILPNMAKGTASRLRQHLVRQGIETVSHYRATQVWQGSVFDQTGKSIPADAVLWATGAQAYPWIRASGISVDAGGFVSVDNSLRAISHQRIFAAGDCAGLTPPLPTAGVFSVRMGPILAHNLLADIGGQALQSYIPQRRYLALLGTGGKNAVASWGAYAWQGQWVWHWKQAVDRRFVALFGSD